MTMTNIVTFEAMSTIALSLVQTQYSNEEGLPSVNPTNDYTTTSITVNSTFIDFTVTRPLEPTNTSDYVLALQTNTTMIWAYGD